MKFPDNVTADFERATLPPVMIDIEEIKQVIRNLTNNAVDSMTHSGKRLLRTSCPGRKTITLQIKVTGCSIPQEIMVKIFEPFFSTNSKGTGPGLAVVNVSSRSVTKGWCGWRALRTEARVSIILIWPRKHKEAGRNGTSTFRTHR